MVAIPDELLGNRIVALVVPLEGSGLDVQDLQAHCSQRLPRYMIPEKITFQAELPKTSSGKINRPLLASLEQPAKNITDPASPAERVIPAGSLGEVTS